jgi:holin-like protein
MYGFAVLIGYYLLGTLLQSIFGLPLPANVIGLILFTISLFTGIVKIEKVEASAQFFIQHMLLFFAPIVVGTMVFFSFIGQQALIILISLFASTFGVLLFTGWLVQWTGRGTRKGGQHEHEAS